MTVTVQSFRLNFPQFADTEVFPDPLLAFWLTTSANFVNADRWGALTDYGVSLVLAHFLTLLARDVAVAELGGNPGEASGPVSSKSVGKVSVSYATDATALANGGNWNATSFGQQYLTQARVMGAGPLQIGTGADAEAGVSAYSSVGAWYGPLGG